MSTFPLRIGTPDGLLFEGNVERVISELSAVIWPFLPDTVITVLPWEWAKPVW